MTAAYVRSSRALDWWCSTAILGLGLLFAAPGDSLIYGGTNRLGEIMPEAGWATVCIAVGLLRIAALIINGRFYEGAPAVRAVAAIIGAMLWAELAGGFLDLSLRISILAPAFWLNGVLVGCDIHNAMRAASEIIRARRARERR